MFPHAELTIIEGTPSPLTLTKLRSEVYDNVMSVPSEAGGGGFGHLGAVMPAAEYIALPGAVAYDAPVHPGVQVPAIAGATAIQITQANRVYDKSLERFKLHNSVDIAVKQQILTAVDERFVSTLRDHTLGFALVTAAQILAHLETTYNTVTSEVLEKNRSNISAEWNPDDGMETIYTRITAAQQFATAAGADNAISDATAIFLAITAIENTGIFGDACSDWRKLANADQTMDRFKLDMTHAWKERNRRISAKSAGYEALLITRADTKENKSPNKPPTQTTPDVLVGTVPMFYCWTHGLGFSSNHTSCTCKTKADGHVEDATIKNRKGGSNRISGYSRRNN